VIVIALSREDELALIHLKNSPAFQLLKGLIEQEKIKPIERQLLGESGKSIPFSSYRGLLRFNRLQAERNGLKAVFSYLDSLTKEKPKKINDEKDV
jgi:hypothetical protein